MTAYAMQFGPTTRLIGPDKAVIEGPAPLAKGQEPKIDRRRARSASLKTTEHRGRSRSSVARLSNENRARRLLEQKLDYIYHRGFDDPNAEERFLAPMPGDTREAHAEDRPLVGLPPHLGGLLANAVLLRPEDEAHLFLKMNYLKYRACKLREALDLSRVRASELAEIERLLAETHSVKSHIVRSCLRLVVSLAKNRAGPNRSFSELVSDGNLYLVGAAEKFDVSRGFKFSTYAFSAITRGFARLTFSETGWRRRFVTGQSELFEALAGRNDDPGGEHGRDENQQAVRRMLGELSVRERFVIVGRFGLEGAREKTLGELGIEMGVSRERVRQIEYRARAKLRKFASEHGLEDAAACRAVWGPSS
jgi:RNA polymerase primary sigma factor